MTARSIVITACCVLATALSACATQSDVFLHTTHRTRYAIQAEEFDRLQLYLSREILAHADDAGATPAPADVIIVAAGTPGLAIEAGPRWLRVAFQSGGPGVYFLASNQGTDSAYLLATPRPGGEGLVRVKDLPEPVLVQEGRTYRIQYGGDAYLRADTGDLADLIKSRPRPAGLERE